MLDDLTVSVWTFWTEYDQSEEDIMGCNLEDCLRQWMERHPLFQGTLWACPVSGGPEDVVELVCPAAGCPARQARDGKHAGAGAESWEEVSHEEKSGV